MNANPRRGTMTTPMTERKKKKRRNTKNTNHTDTADTAAPRDPGIQAHNAAITRTHTGEVDCNSKVLDFQLYIYS